jgi:hypothetical protein
VGEIVGQGYICMKGYLNPVSGLETFDKVGGYLHGRTSG